MKSNGSFKILIRNLRIRKDEKYKIQENENTLLPREESKNI